MLDINKRLRKYNTSILPNTVLYDPLEKKHFATTPESKVIPNSFHKSLELVMNGIDFSKYKTVTNCIAM